MRKPKAKAKVKAKSRPLKLDAKAKTAGNRAMKNLAAEYRRNGKASAKAAVKMKRDATGNTPLARTIGQPTLPVDQVKVGKRYRTDFGDLDALARSIDDRGGLIHPIAITPGHHLIAGERRLKAWQRSKFAADPIPVRIIDIDSILAGEWDENAPGIRKDFSYSEAVAIAEALLPLEKARAAARKAGQGVKADPAVKGNAADKVAGMVGMDRQTLERAKQVVEAARDNPEQFAGLLEQMDRNGVNGPFKRLQNMRASAKIKAEPPPLPGKGPYRTGVIDPPWAAEPDGESPAQSGRGYFNYPTMTTAELAAMAPAIRALLHPEGAWIWVWVTNFHLVKGHAFTVLDAWGFERVHIRTGFKDKVGRGQVLRGQTEHVILCKVGNPPAVNLTNQTTAFDFKVRADSQKPDNFYADVEALTPAPRYFELFARRAMPDNWDGHGDQVGALGPTIFDQLEAKQAAEPPAKPKRQRKDKPAPPLACECGTALTILNSYNVAGSTVAICKECFDKLAAAADAVEPHGYPVPSAALLAERKRLDAPILAGTHVEVRIGGYGALYEAFDLISLKTGAGSGYARYPVPNDWAADLATCNAAIAGLDASEVEMLALGTDTAEAIARRSHDLGKAHALLGAFARGWWKRDDEQPPADDAEGIPAFLRREASKTSAAA